MHCSISSPIKTSQVVKLINQTPLRPVFLIIVASLLPSLSVEGGDGAYPNFNTAEGDNALFQIATGASGATGHDNTTLGYGTLYNNLSGGNRKRKIDVLLL